jgi:peptidyl-dipeptidase A
MVTGQTTDPEKAFREFLDSHIKTVEPLFKEYSIAAWAASLSGKTEDFQKAADLDLKTRTIYSNRPEFAAIKAWKQGGKITDPLLARQLEILYLSYLPNQIDADLLKQIVQQGVKVEEEFNTFRGTYQGRKVTGNEIKDLLKDLTDSDLRRQAWEASQQVGPAVAPDILTLIKLRNQSAKQLGYENFHTMSLELSEQTVPQIDAIFAELARLTDKPFATIKADLDKALAQKYSVAPDKIQPWHYHDPFFQEVPTVFAVDFDSYYKGKDVVALGAKFYAGIGLPVEEILKRSDLYEKPGKNPHAFCTDIDRLGDVRIVLNLKDNERWMETTLHELGHGVYSRYNSPQVPYLLRTQAHIFTTEAIAMFFGRLSVNPDWMKAMLQLTDDQTKKVAGDSERMLRYKQLVFARWAMVMYEFEKRLYADPDQDLNALWWQIKQKYQFQNKPDGRNQADWAAKIHIATAPCYYHNYLLGELLASQLNNKMKTDGVAPGLVGQPKVGQFLRKNIFEPGAIYPWNEMIRRATGEELTAKYFVRQFVN